MVRIFVQHYLLLQDADFLNEKYAECKNKNSDCKVEKCIYNKLKVRGDVEMYKMRMESCMTTNNFCSKTMGCHFEMFTLLPNNVYQPKPQLYTNITTDCKSKSSTECPISECIYTKIQNAIYYGFRKYESRMEICIKNGENVCKCHKQWSLYLPNSVNETPV